MTDPATPARARAVLLATLVSASSPVHAQNDSSPLRDLYETTRDGHIVYLKARCSNGRELQLRVEGATETVCVQSANRERECHKGRLEHEVAERACASLR